MALEESACISAQDGILRSQMAHYDRQLRGSILRVLYSTIQYLLQVTTSSIRKE